MLQGLVQGEKPKGSAGDAGKRRTVITDVQVKAFDIFRGQGNSTLSQKFFSVGRGKLENDLEV